MITSTRIPFAQEKRDRLTYAFGHAVSSHMIDAHSADSGELAIEVLSDLGLTEEEIEIVGYIAEHVAFNYEWTGEGEALARSDWER